MKPPDARDLALVYCMAFDPALFAKRDTYTCAKGGTVHAPNSYVYMLCRRLDADHRVLKYRHGGVRYTYFHPAHRREMGGYFDFDVQTTTGRKLVYVTPCLRVHTPVEEAMIEGAECAARDHKAAFELITEVELFGPNPEYMTSVVRYVMDKLYLREKDDAGHPHYHRQDDAGPPPPV